MGLGLECEQCGGYGYVREPGVQGVTRCACVARKVLAQTLRAASIPARFDAASFASFVPKGRGASIEAAIRSAQQFVHDWTPGGANMGLLLHGSVGSGKTHLAVAILRELIETRGVHGLFVDFRELLENVKATFNGGGGGTQAQVLRGVLTEELVVLDELGAMRSTEWVADCIELVLNKRYNGNLCTIITTNYSNHGPGGGHGVAEEEPAQQYKRRATDERRQETLGDRIGARMFSRVTEMCVSMHVEGADYRAKKSRLAM